MHVAVLGAGAVGVSSAYYLAARGYDVTLIDKAAAPAAGTSYANGGQLAYSFADALAQPSLLPTIPGLIGGRDPAMHVSVFAKPPLLGWGMSFLAQCTARRARANTRAVLDLARQSAVCLDDLRERTGIQFSFVRSGKLMLLPAGTNLQAVREAVQLKNAEGCETSLLSMHEAIALAPQLEHFPLEYAGAVHAPGDDVGDAREYSINLADWLQANRNVECHYGVTVGAIELSAGKVSGVISDSGRIAADAVLVCLGSQSPVLLRKHGVKCPIYPLRGYSITLPPGPAPPSFSITDVKRRIVFSVLNGQIRIAGLADLVGNDHSRDSSRIEDLRTMAKAIAPQYADYEAPDVQPWAGDRPMTPDSRPLVGATGIPGLYLNCGHGMLGWTLAAATAQLAADKIAQAAG